MSTYIIPRKIHRFEIFRPGMSLKTWLDKQTDKPDILLNCSLYHADGKPIGTIIEGGKMVNNAGGGFGFGTTDGASVGFGGPWDKAWQDYITGYYGIVQQGKAVDKPWSDGYVFDQKLSRIAFGQLKDGRYAVFTANGVNIEQLAVQGVQAGFESLCNLDGGGSRALYWLGSWVYTSTRTPYNAIAIWLEPETKEEKPMSKTFKVCLDAGHYGNYNAGAVKGYYESVRMWKLHELVAKELTARGIAVIKTRANQKTDLALTSRGRKAKGCDLFISLHSNAASSESVDYPLAIVPLNGSGTAIGAKLADCVCSVMGTVQKGRTTTKRGSTGADYYGVIRGAVSVGVPGIILEHSFHTNRKATNWLMSDANLAKLAQAEANCIAEYLGVESKPVVSNGSTTAHYGIKITCDALNIRTGPGTGYKIAGVIRDKKTYTITKEQNGWGLLKSKVGWISLAYTRKV